MVTAVVAVGLEGLGKKPVLQTKFVKHPDRIGRLLDAGPETGEAPCLLIDADIEANPAQAGRSSQAADAGADDGDMGLALWHPSSSLGRSVSYVTIAGKRTGQVGLKLDDGQR